LGTGSNVLVGVKVGFEPRLETVQHCLLVILGADSTDQKELVGLWDGSREIELVWHQLLFDEYLFYSSQPLESENREFRYPSNKT
jgi:hypothetical protein